MFNYNLRQLAGAALILFSLTPAARAAGGEVENGGDTVFCRVGGDNNLVGYFSLDYLLTYQVRNNNADVVDRSWDESKARISRLLAAKFPALRHSFDEFTALILSSDLESTRIWHEAGFGLEDISDERILRKLPPNCVQRNEAGTPEMIQSVIRTSRPDATVFQYDYEIIENLQRNAPLQFSFLMVHEWLWDFTDDVNVIRDINRLIHSNQFEGFTTQQQAILAFENLGLSLRRPKSPPVCVRTNQVRSELERISSQSCENMVSGAGVDADIANEPRDGGGRHGSYSLELSSQDIKDLKIGDFAGLANVDLVNLSGNYLRELDAFDFSGLVGAEYIYIRQNNILRVDSSAFDGLQSLVELSLKDNPVEVIESGAFRDLKKIRFIDLEGNSLQTIPVNFFSAIRSHYIDSGTNLIVRLHGNKPIILPDGLCNGITAGRRGPGAGSTDYFGIYLGFWRDQNPALDLPERFPCLVFQRHSRD
jgi:hypothetical protein